MASARARVIEAYGSRCVWCGATTDLEIDHLDQGTGNAHRKAIGMKIEYWLVREFERTGEWPTLVRLLCRPCHNRRSGRIPRMPTKPGTQQHNIVLDETMSRQLIALASAPDYGS